jgi:hypothetical protein
VVEFGEWFCKDYPAETDTFLNEIHSILKFSLHYQKNNGYGY